MVKFNPGIHRTVEVVRDQLQTFGPAMNGGGDRLEPVAIRAARTLIAEHTPTHQEITTIDGTIFVHPDRRVLGYVHDTFESGQAMYIYGVVDK